MTVKVQRTNRFLRDLKFWADNDRKTLAKVLDMVDAVSVDPFEAGQRLERLRGGDPPMYSRRINQRDRFVYSVDRGTIVLHSCRFHYDDH